METGEAGSKKHRANPTNHQWFYLTSDLLSLIVGKLQFADRIRFRLVCKDWRNIPIGDRPINEVPWIMSHMDFYSSEGKKLRVLLSDPVHKKTHPLSHYLGSISKYFPCFKVCASKCGWILLQNCKNRVLDLFLYSPFNSNVITLPNIYSFYALWYQATFSSTSPKSRNCIFIVICRHPKKRKLMTYTYRYGDNEWRTKIHDQYLNGRVASLVCTEKGVCYFVLESGKLGAFSLQSQECTWLVNSDWTSGGYMHLVESNGELFLAKCGVSSYYNCKVYKYDVNARGWIEQETLGNKVLFVCYYSCYLRPAIGDTAYLADKIVYHYNLFGTSEIKVYSLKNGIWYKSNRAYGWMEENSLDKLFIEPPY